VLIFFSLVLILGTWRFFVEFKKVKKWKKKEQAKGDNWDKENPL
jgi:hypothetical protein